MGREVSESCVESLVAEIVSSYCRGFYADKPELAAPRIEAIGFQVGHQLSERFVCITVCIDSYLIGWVVCLLTSIKEEESNRLAKMECLMPFHQLALAVLLCLSMWSALGVYEFRYTMDRPRFTDHLEAIKFICKDFWSELFKKQIDNLKTNHRGTFVLQDNRFRWLAHMSVDPSVETTGSIQDPSAMAENRAAQATGLHLYFPCGIIRGALSNLGIPCAVSADISNLPAWEFDIAASSHT
ncbi:UNVERIFIED_CONTAM: Trafficking protein particle complex subunit 6B [Sesamum indicum]